MLQILREEKDSGPRVSPSDKVCLLNPVSPRTPLRHSWGRRWERCPDRRQHPHPDPLEDMGPEAAGQRQAGLSATDTPQALGLNHR